MDISSGLSQYAGRKQLRRLAASLSLQADEPGSLASLLELDKARVRTALGKTFNAASERAAVEAVITEWMEHGPPEDVIETQALDSHDSTVMTPDVPPSNLKQAAPPKCCVECHNRTPYVFQLMDCRLCRQCERVHAKYTLMTFALVRSIHGLSQADLAGVSSMGQGDKRCYLRSDVEACALRVHGNKLAELNALRTNSSKQWKENSFSVDRHGKTQKWKEWNSVTYQKKQAMRKQDCGNNTAIGEAMLDCMDLSGLVYAD
jgi:hypothetical protein